MNNLSLSLSLEPSYTDCETSKCIQIEKRKGKSAVMTEISKQRKEPDVLVGQRTIWTVLFYPLKMNQTRLIIFYMISCQSCQ